MSDETVYVGVEIVRLYARCAFCGEETTFPPGDDGAAALEAWLSSHREPYQRGADVMHEGKLMFLTPDGLAGALP